MKSMKRPGPGWNFSSKSSGLRSVNPKYSIGKKTAISAYIGKMMDDITFKCHPSLKIDRTRNSAATLEKLDTYVYAQNITLI